MRVGSWGGKADWKTIHSTEEKFEGGDHYSAAQRPLPFPVLLLVL